MITIKVGAAASLSSSKGSFGSFRNANDFSSSYRTFRQPSHFGMVFHFAAGESGGAPSKIQKDKVRICIIHYSRALRALLALRAWGWVVRSDKRGSLRSQAPAVCLLR